MNVIIIGIGNNGFEITKLLANDNFILLVARNLPEYLKSFMVDHKNVFYLQGDATSFPDMERIRDSKIVNDFGTIDLIICTPGTASESTFLNDFDGFHDCFYLNYFANVIPVKVFANCISSEKGGKLVLMSATSGHHADTRLSGYAASKWALENVFSTLREELRSKNITVDVVAVRTIKNKYSKVWTQNYGEDPKEIAKYIYKLIQKPQNKRHFIPKRYSLIRLIERLFPILLDFKHGLRNVRSRKDFFKKTKSEIVLITGAASGLGKALAHIYSKTAKELFLCDLDMEGLILLKKELTISNGCIVNISKVNILNKEEIINYSNSIQFVDLLINNAGVRYQGTIENTSIDNFKKNLEINFFGPLSFISNFMSKLIPPKKIINILSTTAIRGRSQHGLYSSAKAALWNCTRSLRRVYGSKIQIIEVIPSAMSMTKLMENSIVSVQNEKKFAFVEKKKNLQSNVKLFQIKNWSAFDAAKLIQQYEEQGKEILFIPPIRAKLFLILETCSNWLFCKLFKA